MFLLEPDEVYYVVKGKPVTITCRAAPAVRIYVKCVGQWIDPGQHTIAEQVDPTTGVRYVQTSVDVTKEEVDEHFGVDGYECECQAWNSAAGVGQPMIARSRKAKLQVACKYSV